MDLTLARTFVGGAVLVLAACGEPTLDPPVRSTPATSALVAESSAPADTLEDALHGAVHMRCDVTETELTTDSDRRVTLRADGLPGASPTILVIHGYTGTPESVERVAGISDVANAAGIAVAYPLGTPTSIGGFGWDTGADVYANSGVDDVEALVDVLDALDATGCVDPERVVITGESNGGGMTLAALCDPRLAGRFRAAVMVVPAIDDGVLNRCGASVAPITPLVAVAGRIDQTTPFEGGNGLLPQLEWFGQIAAMRGCAAVDTARPITEFADRHRASECNSCTELIAVSDGPHTWPGTSQGNGDLVPGTFDLNRRIIDDLLAPEPGCLSER